MHLILNSSTGTLVTVVISTVPDEGFLHKSVCWQAKPAHIAHRKKKKERLRKQQKAPHINLG